MIINSYKAVGLNTDQQAAQAVSSIGVANLFGLIDLTCDDAFIRGRQLLSDLVDFYNQEDSGNVSENLNQTFNKATEELKDLEEYDLLLAVISSKALYILGKGRVSVYLRRAGQTIELLKEGDGQLISGFIEEKDRIFLATHNLYQFFATELDNLLSLPSEQLEEEITEKLNLDTSEGLAGLVVFIDPDIDEAASAEMAIPNVEVPQKMNLKLKLPSLRLASVSSLLIKFIPRSGRAKLLIAIVLILVLLGGLGLKVKATKDAEQTATFNQLFAQAKDDFNASVGLASLNPGEASNKISSAKDNLDKALKIKPKDPSALELKNQIDSQGQAVAQKFDSQLSLFLDLNLVKEGFKTSQLSLSDGKLLVLDSSSTTLASIDLSKKSQQILASKETLGNALLASINGSSAFVYSKDKGLLKLDLGNKKAVIVAKTDEEWGRIVDICGFGSNVYALDSAGNQIWKYLPTEGGFSDKRAYLTAETKADFGAAFRIQIESSVYVLGQGGLVQRFTKGEQDNFSYGGLDKGVKDPKSFFVSSETDNLYLLDSGNSRLLVLSKTGEYKAQYSSDQFASGSDLVVDEVGKKVYLLDNSKIYVMELR